MVQPAGVVSNISTPPGLLMSDVHVAESCAGAAMVLEHTNEAQQGWGPPGVGSCKSPMESLKSGDRQQEGATQPRLYQEI